LTFNQPPAILKVTSEGELILVKMNRDEMLSYIRQFDGKYYNKEKEAEAKKAVCKIQDLLKKFGFKFSSAPFKDGGFYRFYTDDKQHEYIEVQTGYITEQSKPYGKHRKRYVNGFKGILRVHNHKVSLNPETGEPWKIGDTKHHESGCYSVTLTKRGWYSGD
jgi:hypothetical protein